MTGSVKQVKALLVARCRNEKRKISFNEFKGTPYKAFHFKTSIN